MVLIQIESQVYKDFFSLYVFIRYQYLTNITIVVGDPHM